jgi:hypothetical protein
MERRRALAWAGSIALTAGAGALVLGSLVGGFGLAPPAVQQEQVTRPGPRPGGAEPQPIPGGAEAEPAPPGAEARSAPRLMSAAGPGPRSPTNGGKFPASVTATPSSNPDEVLWCDAAMGDPPEPTMKSPSSRAAAVPGQRGTPVGGQSRSKASQQGIIAETDVELGGTPDGRRIRSQSPGWPGTSGAAAEVGTSGPSSVRSRAVTPGPSPTGGPKTAVEDHARRGQDGHDG